MKVGTLALAVILAWLPLKSAVANDDSECGPLREFVASVQPGETRSFAFRTSWGRTFKDDEKAPDQFALYSKRCEHHDYGPAQTACAYLMEHGSVEVADGNLKQAVNCLSQESHLAGVWFESAVLSLSYGDDNRGANVDLELAEDPQVGGMVLKVTAIGY